MSFTQRDIEESSGMVMAEYNQMASATAGFNRGAGQQTFKYDDERNYSAGEEYNEYNDNNTGDSGGGLTGASPMAMFME